MKIPFLLAVLLATSISSLAIEKKDISAIDTDALTNETQSQAASPDNCVNFVWWIPQEFWAAVLSKDTSLTEVQRKTFLNAFAPYSVLAVCQADISTMGHFDYYKEQSVREGMSVYVVDEAGKKTPVKPLDEIPTEVEVAFSVFRPMLKSAMGRLGENLHFFLLPDKGPKGRRVIDPYLTQTFSCQLTRSNSDVITAQIGLPLDSLFVPRTCPNGKKAHVSWRYCPWTGKPLEK